MVDGELVEGGFGEMMCATCFARGARGEEGFGRGDAGGEGIIRIFKGIGGNGGDFFPMRDVIWGEVEVVSVSFVGGDLVVLMLEDSACGLVEIFFSLSLDPLPEPSVLVSLGGI